MRRSRNELNLPGALLLTFSFLLGILALLLGYVRYSAPDGGSFDWETFWKDFHANITTELGSIAITVFIVDRLAARRDKQRDTRELKDRLVREAGSQSNELAKNAVFEMNKRGWLRATGKWSFQPHSLLIDGDLRDADLRNARFGYDRLNNKGHKGRHDLHGVGFVNANLEAAFLHHTDLQGADFSAANLKNANLFDAWLQDANFFCADLSGADLGHTKLKGALFWRTNLIGANLRDAKLDGAIIFDCSIDETTRLPSDANVVWTRAGINWGKTGVKSEFCNDGPKISSFHNANLRSADLVGFQLQNVDLCGADLRGAKLNGADLTGARLCDEFGFAIIDGTTVFSEDTILPDGSFWTPETDMRKFTVWDPDSQSHPFWSRIRRWRAAQNRRVRSASRS